MEPEIPKLKNISAAVRIYAAKCPDKVFLIDKGTEYTFAQVDSYLNRSCNQFESQGLKPGEVISAILSNSAEYILLYLAALRYGCIFNPYPYTLEAKDISRYLDIIRPRIVLCQDRHHQGLSQMNRYNLFYVAKGFIEGLAGQEDKPYDYIPEEDTPACIYYSSGTTGNPKGIVFSHHNMMADISSIVRGFRFTDREVHLIILPLGHTASVNYSFLPCTLCGGTLVITESYWKIRSRFWQYIRDYGITYVEVVPSILVALLNTPYKKEDYAGIKTLPYVGCGSSTLPKEKQILFQEKYGIKVANLYGLSETGPTHIDYPLEAGWEPGSLGRPLDVNVVQIMDEEGNTLIPGEVGEIVVKGDNVFIGYHNNPRLYEQMVKDGYFHTGDLGYRDKDGKFYFTGRKKDLIIKGGVNISPEEIDEILYKMDAIEEAITTGLPDEYLGEKIISFVVLKQGRQATGDDIREFCRNYLSRDKIPDQVEFVDTIPKGPSGKLLRRVMREKANG